MQDKFNKSFLSLYLVAVTVSIAAMELFSALCLISLLITLVHRKKRGLPLPPLRSSIDYFLFGFWILASVCAFTLDSVPAEKRIYIVGSFRWIIFFYVMRILICMYYEFFKKFLKYFYAVLLIISVYTVYQSQTGVDIVRPEKAQSNSVPPPNATKEERKQYPSIIRTHGFYSSIMSFSYVFGMIFCYVLAFFLLARDRKYQIATAVLLLPLGLSLYFTYTRGLWLALLCSVLLLATYKSLKTTLKGFVFIVLLTITAYSTSESFRNRVSNKSQMSSQSNSERMGIWKANLQIFKENPILGVGYRQNYLQVPEKYTQLGIKSKFVSHAHNNLLEILSGLGIIGFILYLGFNFKFFHTAHRQFLRTNEENWVSRALLLGGLGALTCFHIGGMTEATFLDAETINAFLATNAITYAIADHLRLAG